MMRERVKHLALCTMGYGHIGDGMYQEYNTPVCTEYCYTITW